MKLIIATHNRDKLSEIRLALDGLGLDIKSLDDFPDLPEVIEDGDTLEANALKKAKSAVKATGLAALADDTGLEVMALDGRPGVFSARYAGEGASYADNCRKLLRELKNIPLNQRVAIFRCVIVVVRPNGDKEIIEGRCDGWITLAPRGTGGFGYDPIFEISKSGKTFAEMMPQEKATISHRGRALAELRKRLSLRGTK